MGGMKKRRPGRKKAAAKKRNQKAMIYVVAGIMLLSGFYMFSRKIDAPLRESLSEDIEEYDVERIGNKTGIIEVTEATGELVVLPKNPKYLRYESIRSLLNYSSENISNTTAESTNAYLIFKLHYTTDSPPMEEVEKLLQGELGEYKLMSGYNGLIGTSSTYLMGSLNLSKGDFVRAILLRRVEGGAESGIVGIETKKVFGGSKLPAEVLSVGRFRVADNFNESVNLTPIIEGITLENLTFTPFAFNVDGAEEILSDALSGLSNTTIESKDNKTMVWTSHEVDDVGERISELGVNFTTTDGIISFRVPENISYRLLNSRLTEAGLGDAEVGREGFVRTVPEFASDGRAVTLDNYGNFSVILKPETSASDNITIEVPTISLQDRIMTFQAREV